MKQIFKTLRIDTAEEKFFFVGITILLVLNILQSILKSIG